MRKLAVVFALAMLPMSAARAQPFCPGVAPWVFADVQASDTFCTSITWMATTGVTTSCQVIDASNRLYCPDAFVTRKQMAAFMSRLGKDVAFAEGGNAFGTLPNNTALLGTADGNALDVRVNNSRVMRYEPNSISPNVIGGSPANSVTAGVRGATIAGGGVPAGTEPSYGEGSPNSVTDVYGTVGGGYGNRAGDNTGTTIDRAFATVGGGWRNRASGLGSTIGGGGGNHASGEASTVGGGVLNIANGTLSTVPGGDSNEANGAFSFAAGRRAKASYPGAFLWADSTNLDFRVQSNEVTGGWGNAANTFNVRATGGVWFVTAVDGTGRPTVGAYLNPGSGTWNVSSDAAAKLDVHAIDPQEVLAKALTIEVSRWRYRTAPGIVHIGPMAQDFHRAFNVGSDERSIATIDGDGVALAAIQGLNAKLEARVAAKDAEIAALKREMADLRLAVEVLMARSSTDGRVAQTR